MISSMFTFSRAAGCRGADSRGPNKRPSNQRILQMEALVKARQLLKDIKSQREPAEKNLRFLLAPGADLGYTEFKQDRNGVK